LYRPERGSYAKEVVCLTKKRREIAMVHTLVPSDRVEAASVYGRDGDRIGTIERLMLEKMTGIVAYAVVKPYCLVAGGEGPASVTQNCGRKNYSLNSMS
jgi:hypothetical protein